MAEVNNAPGAFSQLTDNRFRILSKSARKLEIIFQNQHPIERMRTSIPENM